MHFSSNRISSKKSNDILQAYHLLETVKAQFHDIRANIDIFHEEWYKVALELVEKVQLQEACLVVVTDKIIEIINHIGIVRRLKIQYYHPFS